MFSPGSDTATTIAGRVEARAGLGKQHGYTDKKDSIVRVAKVIKVGPLENFECSLIVYIFGMCEFQKIEATLGEGASSSISTGRFTPYFPGDLVLVVPLFGDTTRHCIIGRTYDQSGLSEFIQCSNSTTSTSGVSGPPNIPIPGMQSPKSNITVSPNPLAPFPLGTNQLGFCSITCTPLLLLG